MTTTIGPDTRIDGRVEGDSDVLVEGRVDGTIVLSETLTVADGGFVTGDVEARVVIVEGAVSGTLRAADLVHLTSTAQASVQIYANAVRLDPGAQLKGRIEMDVEAAPPLPDRPARSQRSPSPSRSSGKKKSRSAPKEPEPADEQEPEPQEKRQPARKKSSNSRTNGELDVDPDSLTVKELREMLTERDLPVSGTKSELVDRLRHGE